jgi:hypothetical protein
VTRRRHWIVCLVSAAAIVMASLPAGAGRISRPDAPRLLTVAGPDATVVASPQGGFDVTVPDLYPLAGYSASPQATGTGVRVPFGFATELLDREGVSALLRRPGAPRSEDAMLVKLTDTTVTPDGRYTAHAAVTNQAGDPLLGRAARGVDRRLGAGAKPLEITLPDPNGEMADVMPARIQVVDSDYEVTSNNIFNFTPLPNKLVYEPSGGGTCVKEFKRRSTEDFTDNWIHLRGFTVNSDFECWFQVSKASYTVTVGDRTLNLDVEQESVTNSNFKVTRCDGAGLICKGSNGFHEFTINIFKS